MNKAPFIATVRHRIATDGDGVTTLCGFYGCPLRCKYCLNPQSFSAKTKTTEYTPASLYEKVKIDDLYFVATNGGVTFGGGEPLLYPDFIANFRKLCGDRWNISVETSLNVPRDSVIKAAECVDWFFVDIKDTNPEIYKAYTGSDNDAVLENLSLLLSFVPSERITVRVPLIKDYNTDSDREKSVSLLQSIGVTKLDLFEYVIR